MLLISYGTRPEWLKVKPIIDELKKRNFKYKTIFTGQHDMLKNISSDYSLNISDDLSIDRLSSVMSSCINGTSKVLLLDKEITHVLVQGDTTSALGVAIGAFHNKVKVIHLEAGLRTNDLNNPYPEEANRQLIARISSLNFPATNENYLNLLSEDLRMVPSYVVGNTGLDNLLEYKSKTFFGENILVTLHRRENHEKIKDWFEAINQLAKNFGNYKFILPIHPNPNVRKYSDVLTNVTVVEPLAHDELLNILIGCSLVISDSGGLQEECSFLGKKILVCRKTTERIEALGSSSFLCSEPSELENLFKKHIKTPKPTGKCPFGDGKSSIKIVDILKKDVYLS